MAWAQSGCSVNTRQTLTQVVEEAQVVQSEGTACAKAQARLQLQLGKSGDRLCSNSDTPWGATGHLDEDGCILAPLPAGQHHQGW